MIRILLALLVIALSAAAYALTGSSPVVNVPISVTSGGGGGGGAFTGPAGACAAGGTGTVTVSPSTTCQTMDGFGAMGYNVNSTVAAQQWGTSGLGFSIMREPVPYYGTTSNPCNVVQQSCITGGNLNIGYAQTVIAAAGSDLKTLWTVGHYPAALGTSGKDCPIDPGIIPQTGTFLVNFLGSLRTYYSMIPSAVGVQNEPDDNFTCGSTLMTATQIHDVISNIGSAFASNNITVPLLMPETFQVGDLGSWLSPTMNDSTTAAYVTYEASHQYDTDPTVQVVNSFISNGKRLWQTETSAGNGFGPSLCNGCWDPSIADGMMWASIIDHWLAEASASAWIWWQPSGCGNPPVDNECLESDDDVTISKRGYIIGNYAKFIRPGWVMISATHAPQSGVTVTAYKNPANSSFAVVAQNSGSGAVAQAFSLNGQTTASVTPWVTSGSLNLAQQSAVSVGGASFSYTLPATSVTTFVGTFGSAMAGIPCDVGQNAAKIPAPAQLAGFTTCAANLDFTSGVDPHGVNWQDPTTFVKQCGGAIGNNEAINYTIQAYPNSQSNDYNTYTFSDMPCAAVQQRMAQTDPLTNTKGLDNFLLSCDFRATPCESGFPSWAFVSSPFWPSPGAGPNSLGLYQPMYVQITHHWARGSMSDMATTSTCQNYPNIGACQVQYNDFWQNDYSGHAVGTEIDYWETHGVYVSSNDGMDIGSQWGNTSDVNPATTAYRTDGFLITTNPAATIRRNCGYIGQAQIDSGVAFGPCADNTAQGISVIANSSDYWIEDRVHIGCFANPVYNGQYGWIGDANSGSSTSGPCLNPNTRMEHWVADIQVWECPNYWSAPCYGTVITSEAKTPKKWYAKLKDWLDQLSPITPAYGAGPPEPFTHPWRGLWVCPDGSIDPTEKCRPPELSGRDNEWWKACVPGRDDCVWSDDAYIGQVPADPAKGARGGGYCYKKQPFTCSPGGVVPK